MKRIALLFVIFSGMILGSQLLPSNTFLETTNVEYVACIVNNKFEGYTNYSAIALKEISSNITSSQIKLSFFGIPNLNSSHGYRIVISWNEPFNINGIAHWPDYFNWEQAVYPKSNFTQCYAGGVSGFGVVNGSYSEFYNDQGNLICSEINNNSVIIDGNSLVFIVNQSIIGLTPLNPDNQFLAFSNYNTTRTALCTNMPVSISNITLMDALPAYLIDFMYHLITNEESIDFIIFISIIGLVGASQVLKLRKRK